MPKIIEADAFTGGLEPYTCRSEVQLLRYYEPEPGIFIAESPRIIGRAMDVGYEPLSMLLEKKAAEGKARELFARCGDIPVYLAEEPLLAQLTGCHLISGALSVMRRKKLPGAKEICAGAARVAVLEDVVNPTNVGAIFRSAAALSFDAVLLTPGCCDPLYRRAIRVSMGTVFAIPWTFFDCQSPDYVEVLRGLGYTTVAMALCEPSVAIDDPRLKEREKLAVILGTEGEGLRASTIDACDYAAKIPMAQGVDSLNVAAASAVAFWQLGRS